MADRKQVMKIRERIYSVLDWLKRVVHEPRSELTKWQKAVRFVNDLGRHGAKQLQQDRAPQMAAALSFRTLFGLLPVLVVGTITVKAVGQFDAFLGILERFFAGIGLDNFQVQLANAEVGGDVEGQTLSAWLLELVGQVEHINLAAITWVGVVVLIYSAISLLVTIEGSFNIIYRAPEGRSWARRVPIYWTVITLAPGAIAMSMYVDRQFAMFLEGSDTGSWFLQSTPVLWSFVATWLVLFVVYKLLPNSTVGIKPALAGAFMAAVLLEIGKRTMGAYLENAISISQLYGSLGLIPLFMFWVYLMWLVVLFGLEVSAILQLLGGRRMEEYEPKHKPTGVVDPASVLAVMEVVARRFEEGRKTVTREITEETGIAETTVILMIEHLVEQGFLHRLDQEEPAVILARPPDQIPAQSLIEVGFLLADEAGMAQGCGMLHHLREAQRKRASGSTLASILP